MISKDNLDANFEIDSPVTGCSMKSKHREPLSLLADTKASIQRKISVLLAPSS